MAVGERDSQFFILSGIHTRVQAPASHRTLYLAVVHVPSGAPSPPRTMAWAASLAGALLVGGALGWLSCGYPPWRRRHYWQGSPHAALWAATQRVQVMVLKDTCSNECQAGMMPQSTEAGCDQARRFLTRRMASAQCATRPPRQSSASHPRQPPHPGCDSRRHSH